MRGARFLSAGNATTAILVVGYLTALAVNWPGHLSVDFIIQLLEGRTGVYNTWHPPVMAWMLGVGDYLLPGAGLFAVFDTTLAFASLLALSRMQPRTSWAAVLAALLCVLSPQFLLYQGIIWKDVLFADAAVAGYVCLALAASRWEDRRARFSFILISLLLLSLATLVRQNGAIVAFVGALTLGAIAFSCAPEDRLKSGIRYVVVALATIVAFTVCATLALDTRSDGGDGRRAELKTLQIYDLAGAAASLPGIRLEIFQTHDPVLERLTRTDGGRLFSPTRVDTLQKSPALKEAFDAASSAMMTAQWVNFIVRHPLLYLKVRAAIFRWIVLTPKLDDCVPYIVGVWGPPRTMKTLGLAPRIDSRDLALETYANLFVGTPVFSHAAFGVLAAYLAFLLFRRHRPPDLAIGFMLIGSAFFAISFFVISLACDYRYLYFLDISTLAALFYLASDAKLEKHFMRTNGAEG